MLPSFLTATFFALSMVCAGRSTRLVGATTANILRIFVALACLAALAFTIGSGFQGVGLSLFLLSGAVGIGVGDFFGFQAIKRIGPRLSALLVQCLCAPIAAILEFLWLGTRLTPWQITGGSIVLFGTAITLLPGIRVRETSRTLVAGSLLAVLAAASQSVGAVITRRANEANAATGFDLDALSAAFQRVSGAVVVMLVLYLIVRRFSPKRATPITRHDYRRATPWIFANGVLGLVIGVACFQWALKETPAAVVLSIVALTPLFTIPLVRFIDHERPTLLSIVGSVIAIGGVIVLQVG